MSAGSLAWAATPKFDLIADYYHLTSDGLPDWGVPFDVRTQQPFAVPRSNFYGLIKRDFNHGTTDIGTLRLEYRLSPTVKLTSKSRYGDSLNAYIATVPERPNISDPNPANWTVQANPQTRNARTDTYANATELTAEVDTGRFHHTLVGGVEFDHEKIVNRPYAFASSEDSNAVPVTTAVILQNLFNPNPNNPAFNQVRTLSGAVADTIVVTKAAYLLDTIDLTRTVKLTAGVRFDDYIVTSDSTSAPPTTVGGAPATRTDPSQPFELRQLERRADVEAGAARHALLSPRRARPTRAASRPMPRRSATAASARRPTTSIPSATTATRPGAKYEAGKGGHLLLTAAVFRIDKVNGRVVDPLSGVSQVLAGKQRVDGFELGASGNITPRWAVFGGYTYLDARVLATTNPPVAAGPFPNVAANSFAMLTTYRLFDGLTVGGQAFYNSARYGGSTVAGSATLPGYWRFDLTAKATITSKVELQVNVLNLTDKVYYDAIYRSAAPFAYIAPGRLGAGDGAVQAVRRP